jgi:3-phenylpropionate/cinnamic acid dioxygenase small subunit
MDETALSLLKDRVEISDIVIRYARSLDAQDWDLCRSCFVDEIEQDYSDFRGEPPSTIKADEFVALRRRGLAGIKTQHLSTNHAVTVEGDTAECISAMVIFRFRPDGNADNEFDTHGYYTHTLVRTRDGWKISKVKQAVLWSMGNPQVHGFHRDMR